MELASEKLTYNLCYESIDQNLFKLSSPEFRKKNPDWSGYVGMEIEMYPVIVHKDAKKIPSLLHPQHNPLPPLLEKLAKKQGWELVYENIDGKSLLLILKISEGETITFEPGGQVEFSSKPYLCLDAVCKRLVEIQNLLDETLNSENIYLLQLGMEPWHKRSEVSILTPKKRYLAMNEYFSKISPLAGPQMMRQTCSIQVCLDFGHTDELMLKRYATAQALAPFAAAIFANSPCTQENFGESVLSQRTAIWRRLDAKRSGFVGLENIEKNLTRASCVQAYLDFALSCPIVFVEKLGYLVPTKPISMKEWMTHGLQGIFPTMHDFNVHLSLLFPEVRPRGYMELRSIDCQSRVWQSVPADFYVGLLYDEKNLEETWNLLCPMMNRIETLMSYAEKGLQNLELQKVSKTLMQWSIEGIHRIPTGFCGDGTESILSSFYHRFTERDRTPANDLVDRLKTVGRTQLTLEDLKYLEHEWKQSSML